MVSWLRNRAESSHVNELPSVALTKQFLSLCEYHGSQHLVVKLVAVGRGTGVPGLPENDDWMAWDAGQMRAAVDYLEHLRSPGDLERRIQPKLNAGSTEVEHRIRGS